MSEPYGDEENNGTPNPTPPKAIVITFDELGNVSIATSRPDVTLGDYVMASWVLSQTAGKITNAPGPNREQRRASGIITPERKLHRVES